MKSSRGYIRLHQASTCRISLFIITCEKETAWQHLMQNFFDSMQSWYLLDLALCQLVMVQSFREMWSSMDWKAFLHMSITPTITPFLYVKHVYCSVWK